MIKRMRAFLPFGPAVLAGALVIEASLMLLKVKVWVKQ